jgi:hypothetical protein
MALNKTQKQALLDKMLGDRMPKLEAAIESEQKVAAAEAAVSAAQESLDTHREAHAATYASAVEAGWTASDLEAAGVTRVTTSKTRRKSETETAA